MNNEKKRLLEYRKKTSNWKAWGPYLSERAWGTVRENGDENPWGAFPYEEAATRCFRWGEDGLAGASDRFQHICFAFSLWNGKDPLLKERLFGLSNGEGNHGEDVKEYYYYLDSTPTHSYWELLYKYPQEPFPYELLREKNSARGFEDTEYELVDTGIFNENRYFDLYFRYAKVSENDLLIEVTIINRGPETAPLWILPTVWFRNTWSWGYEMGATGDDPGKPHLFSKSENTIAVTHPTAGSYHLYAQEFGPQLYTENETPAKGAFHQAVIAGETLNQREGTKAAFLHELEIESGKAKQVRLRLSQEEQKNPFQDFTALFEKRKKEADQFYAELQKPNLSDELKSIQRQAYAGMLLSKQLYYLDMSQWLGGDPNYTSTQTQSRNLDWEHLTTFDLISMPDKWEYPYFCTWDLAFHCIPLVLVDPDFAKRQLILMTREWYMHPNGQLPAYEWNFSDVNPPVHAWAVWRTYKIDAHKSGEKDRAFLEGVFHKLLVNFTWWVNKKDIEGNNVFQGGFLGMDNISVFDRSSQLPTGGHIDQSDGSAWMSFYCIVMMKMALHLGEQEPVYQDIATKFFEHFLRIAEAMSNCGGKERTHSLWDEDDGFFYDLLHLPDGKVIPLKVRSLVGLLPLLAVETIEPDLLEAMPTFKRRVDWFVSKRPKVACNISCIYTPGLKERRLLSIMTKEQLIKVLSRLLDENEFLSPYGIRSLSKCHENRPYTFHVGEEEYTVKYIPGESNNSMFGGNSNWRGPLWMPINFLLIESLQKYHHYFGDELKVEMPTGSGNFLNLWEVAEELSKRLIRLFSRDSTGKRAIFQDCEMMQHDPHFKEHMLFHEYFHGETGKGLGASHQTGWTGLIAKLIEQSGELL